MYKGRVEHRPQQPVQGAVDQGQPLDQGRIGGGPATAWGSWRRCATTKAGRTAAVVTTAGLLVPQHLPGGIEGDDAAIVTTGVGVMLLDQAPIGGLDLGGAGAGSHHQHAVGTVSYTHLTLSSNRQVYTSAVAVYRKSIIL